jgi:4-amino-4-deoxy-L-arabinose transferase-like glycosyltransferase
LLKAKEVRRGWAWAVAGSALGLALLAKETILFFLPLVLLWLLFEKRSAWRQAVRAGELRDLLSRLGGSP